MTPTAVADAWVFTVQQTCGPGDVWVALLGAFAAGALVVLIVGIIAEARS